MRGGQLISTIWHGETSPLAERAVQALTVVKKIFPEVTVWKAGHKHGRGWDDAFRVTTDTGVASYNHQWEALWEATTAHFARLGLSSDFISVEHCAWSDELGESVNIRFSDMGFKIDVEEENRTDYLTRFREQFLWMLRELGSRPAINAMWLCNDSAFAGDPAYLYDPESPFKEDFHRLPWEEFKAALEAWRATQRAAVRAALTPGQIAGALKELGVKRVEPLGADRLFVQFAELGQPGGEEICKKLERQITERLKRRAK